MFRVSLAHHQCVQLYNTIATSYYHLQCMELWRDHQCTIYKRQYVH